MFYRFIYIVWRIFWSSVLVLLLTLALFLGGVFLLLQTDPARNYLTDQAETWFNERYEGVVYIDEIGGVLPLYAELREVTLEYDGHVPAVFESLTISVDLLALLRNHLTINDITLNAPEFYLQTGDSGRYTIHEALQRTVSEDTEEELYTPTFRTFEIYAPFVQIFDGSLHIVEWNSERDNSRLPEPLNIENINTEMFLEISTGQRYLDINYITMLLQEPVAKEFTLSGQIYNDSQTLEFNAMRMGFGDSHFNWSSEFDGIDLYEGDIANQFRQTSYSMMVEEVLLASEELTAFVNELPDEMPDLQIAFQGEGRGNRLNLANAEIESGRSMIHFDAQLENIRQWSELSYNVDFTSLRVSSDELGPMAPDIAGLPVEDWTALETSGTLQGTSDTVRVDVGVSLPEGSLTMTGGIDLTRPYAADMTIGGRGINLAALDSLTAFPTRINTEIRWSGNRLAGEDYEFFFDADVFGSQLGNVLIPDLQINAEYAGDVIRHDFVYLQQERSLEGRGSIDLRGSTPDILLTGSSSGLNLNGVFQNSELPGTDWDMSYDVNWHGWRPEDWYGRLVVDVLPSTVNGNELRSHQMYLDLNHPDNPNRSLRLTSSVLDLIVEGQARFSSLKTHYEHWERYFSHRIQNELLFQSTDSLSTGGALDEVIQAEVLMELKDVDLLKTYLPELPDISSRAQMSMNLRSDRDSLDLSAQWRDNTSEWNGITVDNPSIDFNSEFRFDRQLRDQLNLNLDITADRIIYNEQELDSLSWVLNIKNGVLYNSTHIANFGNDAFFSTEMDARLTESMIQAEVTEFILGNDRYLWHSEVTPVIRYDEGNRLHVREFDLVSDSDRIFVDGIFSPSPEDSVEYRLVNVNLERISQMMGGKVAFEGILDANLVTKSLFTSPVFHGNINADRLAFDGRVIGDVDLESIYDGEEDRFNTMLEIVTDTTKYADYIEQNDGIRQNITASGWFRRPEAENPASADNFYDFDVIFDEVDLWVLEYLMDNVFDDVEGQGTGKGRLTGDLDFIDFDAEFEVSDARVRPVFLETEYLIDGELSVSREEGIRLHQLDLRDRHGGTGVLSGTLDLNEFRAEKFLDMTLEMDNLIFLNNASGPDVPLFGSVAGTGVVNISGSNISPFVRSVEPIHTTSDSRLSIPLAEQAMTDDQGRFIRFVNDFGDVDLTRQITVDPATLREIDRSFLEVFRLDLHFVAAQNSTVRLIFDPVTDEIVNARGSGRVHITLEDETLQIFGNFNIDDGDYQFVGGDILTRRFTLREGGSIRWEGDPANARLDITAVYSARPNIAPLLGASTEQTNRVPVELLLEITGPINNIANDFYFEFPNAIDATQNAAVLNVLNSEEQKLIQATSLLFTGGFVSGGLVGETQTQELGTTLQSRAGQVGISQLLSSQINALLSGSLINMDVDLNFFGFDQADLGIAVRLFDERLVLRREGEVGGEQTNIGDLGATYRINSNLSVEVFHRKDPMLMSILGDQAQVENVNGLGLEAQFRFNTWREFASGMWRNITTIFGLRKEDEPEPESDEEVAVTGN